MKQSRRISILAPALFLFVAAAPGCFATWDFTTPVDPNRNWGISETTSGEYDDNWYSEPRNQQSGFRLASDFKFHASVVPLQRIFLGIQYDYGIVYPHDANLGGVDQAHNLNISATYAVNPRLALSLSENFVSSFEPGIVQGANGAPVTLSSGGNYIYDAVGAGVNYQLAPRWIASLNGNWDIWRYQTSSIASNNDHEDYSATLSAQYVLDARTEVGLNYQYSQDIYVNSGFNDGLNGYGNTAYLSAVHRFNPQLSLALNGGYTIRNSEDGSTASSPSGSLVLTYNYGPSSRLTMTIAQSLTEASLGSTSSFSAQENTSFALQAYHRITVRLHVTADASYVYSTFKEPLGGTVGTLKPHEQAATGHIGLGYDLRTWISVVADYSYTQLLSSDERIIAPYTRDLVSVGITLSY